MEVPGTFILALSGDVCCLWYLNCFDGGDIFRIDDKDFGKKSYEKMDFSSVILKLE